MIKLKFRSKHRYLNRLIIWTTASITFIVLILSICNYFITHKIFMRSQYETNQKILTQIKYNVEFINQSIRNISDYIFVNPDISSILNSSNTDDYSSNDVYNILNRVVEPILISNDFIDSVCLYNSNTGKYYYNGKSLFFDDESLKNTISKSPNIPKNIPIFREIRSEYGDPPTYYNIITYIIYETSGTPKKVYNAVAVNVKPQWLFNNINAIDMMKSDDHIFILDSNGNFIFDQIKDENMKQILTTQYKNSTGTSQGAISNWEFDYNKDKYLATLCRVEDAGISLLEVQPEKEAYKNINSLNTRVISISFIIFLLSVLIANLVSRNVYKPFGKLIQQIEKNNFDISYNNQDEMSYLYNIYSYSNEKLEIYKQKITQNNSIMKSYWLKKILTERKVLEKTKFEDICSENMICLPYQGYFNVCIIKIDNLAWFQNNNDPKDMELLRFSIINIFMELITGLFQAEYLETSDDNIVIIMASKDDKGDYTNELKDRIKKAQITLSNHFSISVTVSIGSQVEGIIKIAESYEIALNNSMYRYVLGKMSVITYDMVKQNCYNTNSEYPKKFETNLTNSIKAGNLETARENILAILNEISKFNYDNIIVAEICLTESVKKAIENNIIKGASKVVDFEEIEQMAFKLETQQEFSDLLLSAVQRSIGGLYDRELETRNIIIAETAIDIITKNFGDSTLCQNKIADLMKISPRNLSRAFKFNTGLSIVDYIRKIRLKKATELLEKTQINVYDIAFKVGFENESYFYKLFKERFGCTPKQYSLIKNLNYNADITAPESPGTI